MYISNLDYVKLPSDLRDHSELKLVRGGIDISLESFSLAEGDKTAITLTNTKTVAISASFGS